MRRLNWFFSILVYSFFVPSALWTQILIPNVNQLKPLHFTGYYFLVPYKINSNSTDKFKLNTQCVIDTDGELIFFRNVIHGSNFKIQPNGFTSYWSHGKYYILDKNLTIIDSVSCVNGLETDSHEFKILPNGHFLLCGKESEVKDLSYMKLFTALNLAGSKRAVVKYDVIQELDQYKKLVFEWRTRLHFEIDQINPLYLTDTAKVDVTHLNSIDYDSNNNLLLSFRYFDEVIKLNKNSMQIIWRMGGKYNQIKILNDTLPFLGQHDAKFVGDSCIMLFDNGYSYDSLQHNVRGLEYAVNEKTKTAIVKWCYSSKRKIVSLANGNVEMIDGNTRLISYGKTKSKDLNVTFEIVNLQNEVLQTLSFPDTLGTYRTYFVNELPYKLNRPDLKIVQQEGHFVIKTKKNYKYYLWNDGSRKSEITTNTPSMCYVFVSDDGVNYYRSRPLTIRKKH